MTAMDEIEELAEIFKALSDPTRLRLIQLLSEQPSGECPGESCNGRGFLCVNALAHRLGVTQSAVSQHLRVLRQTGLVRGERHGHFVHYSLDKDGLEKYKVALLDTLGEDFAVG
jgi:DNA-binding transcriptional ArsR family regulator